MTSTSKTGSKNKKLLIVIGISVVVIISLIILFSTTKFFQPNTNQKSITSIEYSPISRPCMTTEFVKGYTEDTSSDWSGKDSCGFDIAYEQGEEFANLQLDYPVTSWFQACSTSKDVRDYDKDVLIGNVVEEGPITLGGKSAYKVITEYSGYNYIAVYVCLSDKTYKWGNVEGTPANALYVTGNYKNDFEIEVVDHALANWQWK